MFDTPAQSSNQNPNLPPPGGDPAQAEKYINQLNQLIEADKLNVTHTDLSKFDPNSLQDHYSLDLKDYQVEVSHSKHPGSGKDSYIILFTNIKNLTSSNCNKIILAYMHLNETQFARFKNSSLINIEKKAKAFEEKRIKDALTPIDQILESLSQVTVEHTENFTNSFEHSSPAIS